VLGIGKLPDDAFVFGDLAGKVRNPALLSEAWFKSTRARGLPPVALHSLRHSHASALIASGADIVTVSRRLGHSSPNVTLSVYSHLFSKDDAMVVDAIDAVFENGK
jgi:integrase